MVTGSIHQLTKELARSKIRQMHGIKALLACIKASNDPDVLKNSSEALHMLMLDGNVEE